MKTKAVKTLTPESFEFTVEAGGRRWDVYHFRYRGKVGQLAFAPRTDPNDPVKWDISYMRSGRRTAEEVQAAIAKSLE